MLGDWIDWLHTQPLVLPNHPPTRTGLDQANQLHVTRQILPGNRTSIMPYTSLAWLNCHGGNPENIYMHLPSKEYINRSSCLPYSQYQPIPERHTKWLARNVHYSLFTIHQKCSMVQKCSLFTSITMLVSLFINMICWTFPDEVR